jgi:hypothetical protein
MLPYQTIAENQKLKTVITSYGYPFGVTPTGADWCVKALHPSDPMTEIRGIPDHNAVPSLLMNYQSTFTLSPSPGSTGTWAFDATLLPHPINFMYIDLYDSGHPNGSESNFMNSQIEGATHRDKYQNFIAMAQRWRLAYMSVTCYQDGPDLANQGSIVVCQNPIASYDYNFCRLPNLAGSLIQAWPKVQAYSLEDRPNFAVSQSMPNAYYGRSREGSYVPLKLTETCQDWLTDAHRVGISNYTFPYAGTDIVAMAGGNAPNFPHVNLINCQYTYDTVRLGQATSPLMNATVAHICTKNLAVTTSFTFFVRAGIEMQVSPGSVLSPQLKLAPPYDGTALDTYFRISRELKDAYPADYNDLGRMWDTISRISKRVILPAAALIPGARPIAAAVGTAVQAGDTIRANRQKKKAQKSKAQPPKVPPRPGGSKTKRD